jgi:hypothetical protein
MMNYSQFDTASMDADDSSDAQPSEAVLQQQLTELQTQLDQLPPSTTAVQRASLLLDIGYLQLQLQRRTEAWWTGQEAFLSFVSAEMWENAAQTCDLMFLTEQTNSLIALANGIWLAVTFPIDPEITLNLLNHLIEEMPDNSDGAAIAATTAHYIVDLRATEREHENLNFFTNQLLAQVARQHSQVEDQAGFTAWFKKLELDQPDRFLPRLSQILDILVQGEWWIDRAALRAKLPD